MTIPAPAGPPQPPFSGYGHPHPPRPPKKNTGLKTTAALIGGVALLGIGIAIGSSAGHGNSRPGGSAAPASPSAKPVSPQASSPKTSPQSAKKTPAATPPVKMSATFDKQYAPGPMAEDGKTYTAVDVVVRNEGTKKIAVNPMYFAAKDSTGFKHTATIGTGSDSDLAHADLAPGENVKGTVVFDGTFTPVKIEFRDGMIGTAYSAPVG